MLMWIYKNDGECRWRLAGRRNLLLVVVRLLTALLLWRHAAVTQEHEARAGDEVLTGERLFSRDWLPGDRAAKLGGDGLGPLYDATSCISCHYQGGPGVAGPSSVNIQILAADKREPVANGEGALHPGLAASSTVILHRYGTDPAYAAWRLRLLGDAENARLVGVFEAGVLHARWIAEPARLWAGNGPLPEGLDLSERNPPPLFGLDLINQVPEEALVALEERKFPRFPGVRGRLRRLRDGGIGRFGWKAEIPSLRAAVLASCANQLGLEVPGYHQAESPLARNAPRPGMDLSERDCDALVNYVRHLSPPPGGDSRAGSDPNEIATGRLLFDSVGCTSCHQPRLWQVEGIYSDLLIHDMGGSWLRRSPGVGPFDAELCRSAAGRGNGGPRPSGVTLSRAPTSMMDGRATWTRRSLSTRGKRPNPRCYSLDSHETRDSAFTYFSGP